MKAQNGAILNSLMELTPELGIVAIGRNEGERLRRCLNSLPQDVTTVYVDSGSADDSVQLARTRGADVVELSQQLPFTAARARNAGFRRLVELSPHLSYVQFIDADCEMSRSWIEHAVSFLHSHGEVAAVCGRLRERHPEQSVYNWLCDREWEGGSGEIRACAGNVMIRASALGAAGGYREDVIAAEEDELSVRLRAAGWRIWRLENDMANHDASMTRFDQWWRRALRSGYAFAQGAHLHGRRPERHFVWESCRAWLWGMLVPLLALAGAVLFGLWAWALLLIYPLQILRQATRNSGSLRDRIWLALFQILARFPEVCGQLKYLRDRLLVRQARIIEYK